MEFLNQKRPRISDSWCKDQFYCCKFHKPLFFIVRQLELRGNQGVFIRWNGIVEWPRSLSAFCDDLYPLCLRQGNRDQSCRQILWRHRNAIYKIVCPNLVIPVNPPAYACAYIFIKIYLHVLNARITKVSMREINGVFCSFSTCDHYRSWPLLAIKQQSLPSSTTAELALNFRTPISHAVSSYRPC